ncbi:MAG: hypothetical protein Q6362_005230 [Candidatus Wukongarchaeota archaeon]|nr:circadian clock KaiB family protein [Candidatus Wukongarchaeota archaeon]
MTTNKTEKISKDIGEVFEICPLLRKIRDTYFCMLDLASPTVIFIKLPSSSSKNSHFLKELRDKSKGELKGICFDRVMSNKSDSLIHCFSKKIPIKILGKTVTTKQYKDTMEALDRLKILDPLNPCNECLYKILALQIKTVLLLFVGQEDAYSTKMKVKNTLEELGLNEIIGIKVINLKKATKLAEKYGITETPTLLLGDKKVNIFSEEALKAEIVSYLLVKSLT